MSDESSGAGQSGALPPRENATSRAVMEHPSVRITQVAGTQYVITSHSMPSLTQISSGNGQTTTANLPQGSITRIISLTPSRSGNQTLRPSVANQNIVNALTKPRPSTSARLQLFPTSESPAMVTMSSRMPVKRTSSSSLEERDSYSVKLRKLIDHRNVRSTIVREKYNEHLTEKYFLETAGNILDLPQFVKRPKTLHYITYLKDNVIDIKELADDDDTLTEKSQIKLEVLNDSGSNLSSSNQSSNTASVVQTISSDTKLATAGSSTLKSRPSINYSGSTNQEQIMEKAKQEAYVVQRINDLQKEGLWSEKRLPKVQEMPRSKAHWDFLLEEMVWLAADFAQERKWKKAAAKKCAKMVQKYFQDKALAAQKAEKAQEQHLRRVAAFCAKEIKAFWSNVEKLVEFKQQTRLEEKRKQALDQQLSFIVDQTEKYSQLLAEGMNKSTLNASNLEGPSAPSSKTPSRTNSDDEFKPEDDSSDDEETIALEEAKGEHGQGEEVAALQRESEMDLDTFLSELPKDYLQNRDKISLSDSSEEEKEDESSDRGTSSKEHIRKDEDFIAHSSSGEDDEDTIQEQEITEGKQDHKIELNDLRAESEMSIEELKRKYSNLPPVASVDDSSSESDEDVSAYGGSEESSDEELLSDVNMTISDEDESQNEEVGLKSLLDDSTSAQNEGELKTDNQDLIDDAAAIAESIQPKGNTLSSTSVVTPIPFLLKYTLREYQHIGLDWLVTMYERKLNGILADEMGLGKTIQTIALLAHLACEKENWGPHLIIVPTSVMLNWEMECKKWCPAFKILTYYGTQKERKQKRMGWTKPNAFHICITSYKLVIQDHQSFRRKKWKYLILDEAQNIKNFKSQRWQLLLNFSTQQRLLLTGTPLQNNLMELWSLMHFLMPHVFQSHREFKEWFSNPVTGMIEGNSEYNESIIKRLHKVLRPFLLRRLKSEVEKQMPKKYEHVVMCRLSKRQRFLYDDYMSRAKTKETLVSGNLLSVINVLMQLRKVCNHPNLFEVRPTISPFQCNGINWHIPSLIYAALKYDVWKHIDLYSMNFNLILMELHLNAYQCYRMRQYQTPRKLIEEINNLEELPPSCPPAKLMMRVQKLTSQKDVKSEGSLETVEIKPSINTQTNLKFKIASHQLHFLHQNNPLKVVASSNQITNVLKPDQVLLQSGLAAQVVDTPTGKTLLITQQTNPNVSGTISVPASATVVTTGGQRLTLLSKPGLTTTSGLTLTKSLPKMQLMSIPALAPTSSPGVVSNIANLMRIEEDKETGKKTVGSKFIEKLYSKQTQNTDFRWRVHKTQQSHKKSRHSHSEGGEIHIKDYRKNKFELIARINERRCSAVPLYGRDFHDSIKVFKNSEDLVWGGGRIHCLNALFNINNNDATDCLKDILFTPEERIEQLKETFDRFIFYVPAVQAPEPQLQTWHPDSSTYWGEKQNLDILTKHFSKPATCLHPIASAMVTQFPDPRLIQYDCGKLQTLDRLLRRLKSEGHRVLIFTQMTKMLNVLEAFLNFHGHIYLRLDGSTKVDQRQILMERFNGDPRIFAFILSTRSGGIGVNLTGADTVVFYDSDWNPTMDAQAQDRCHRIGQTRDVHIYRLVSERTIEENILKKANQKRLLGDLAIEGGNFTTAYFKSTTIQDLFNIDSTEETAAGRIEEVIVSNKEREKVNEAIQSGEDKTAVGALENALATCEDDQDVIAARTAKAEAVADLAEFDENIPLEDQEKDKEPEISKAEQEVENLVKQLTPIERYAMRFVEETESAWSAEQLAAAEREIDAQKREWEQNRLLALREEEERLAKELEEQQELLTYSREDATNQVSTKTKKLSSQTKVVNSNKKCIKSVKHKIDIKKSLKMCKRIKTNPGLVKKESVSDSDQDSKSRSLRGRRVQIKSKISRSDTKLSDNEDNSLTSTEGSVISTTKLNGESDLDLKSKYDNISEALSHNLTKSNSLAPNKVDHNSPRTRSRGTVSINLWTLDVSPILPGVKPIKNACNLPQKKEKKVKDTEITPLIIESKKENKGKENEDGLVSVTSCNISSDVKNKESNKNENISVTAKTVVSKKSKTNFKSKIGCDNKKVVPKNSSPKLTIDDVVINASSESHEENCSNEVNSDTSTLAVNSESLSESTGKNACTNLNSEANESDDRLNTNKEKSNETKKNLNNKVCQVIVSDIMSSGVLEGGKYSCNIHNSGDSRNAVSSNDISESPNSSVHDNNVSEITPTLKKGISKKKLKTVSNALKRKFRVTSVSNVLVKKKYKYINKIRSIKKPLFSKRKNRKPSDGTLKNWVVKVAKTDNEQCAVIPVIKDSVEEVRENIALKAEITQLEAANDVNETSLKRFCSNESLDDIGIKTNKIIKTTT